MKYTLPSRSKIEFITLKVGDMNQMVDFYTKIVGLYTIYRNESVAYIGMPKKRFFISMRKINDPSSNKGMANIKSFTLILPTECSFKKSLNFDRSIGIKVRKIYINGACDKYTLKDPEGNHVTLMYWKVKHPSKLSALPLKFKKVSLKDYLGHYKPEEHKLPNSTKFGWIQLSVNDLDKTVQFYHRQLGLKYRSYDNGHQAIILNGNKRQFILKENSHLHQHAADTVGLDYLNAKMFNPRDIANLAQHLKDDKANFTYSKASNFVFVSDPNKINLTFSLL